MFYKKTSYPDKSFYVTVDKFVKEFKFKINSYEDLWELNQLRDVYRYNGKNATIIISCLFEAQADRRFHATDPAGLKLICDFINKMGWEKVKIFHPHNPEVVEALIDNVEIIDNYWFIREILRDLGGRHKSITYFKRNNGILMSSDAGGFKPLMKLCDKLQWEGETFSASKSRQYIDNKSKLIQQIDKQDFEGKDILIIDDICVYGGTFKGLSKLLKERNCGKLYLAVSHMTIQNLGEDPVTNYFDKVFTTNSKYDNYYIPDKTGYSGTQPNNLKIIKLFKYEN
jgi:ribose-phosphate pyrophosphokinase